MITGICLTVKNEALYISEWIVYHLALGFERIWIYDNGSEDKIEEALCSYRERVELIFWPRTPAFPTNIIDCLSRAQAQKADWLAFFEVDDFLVPMNGDPSDVMKTLKQAGRDGIDEIQIPMCHYASGGYILIPNGRVVDNYRMKSRRENYKTIVRVASNTVSYRGHEFKSRRHKLANSLRINHYRNKSKEDDLICRGESFADGPEMKYATDKEPEQECVRNETQTERGSTSSDAVIQLSTKFNTPGTQIHLGADPVKVVILERNQPNGLNLKKQLSAVFRDIVFWDIGSDCPNPSADACFSNEGYTAQTNRAHEKAGNSAILWIIPADVFLNDPPISYKRAIVSAFPFGIWSPKIHDKRRLDQVVPDGKLCSVQFVEGIAWAFSRQARKLGFPLPEGSPLGWGHDLVLSRKCLESGLRNLIDARVSVLHVHEQTYQSYDPKEAEIQMNELLARVSKDRDTFPQGCNLLSTSLTNLDHSRL